MNEEAVTNEVEQTTDSTSPVDETKSTVNDADESTEQSTDTQAEESQDEQLAPKSENRFQQLANTVKEKAEREKQLQAENEQLRQQLFGTTSNFGNSQASKYQIDPNKEYTVDEINSMLQEAQQASGAQAIAAVAQLKAELAQKEAMESFDKGLNDDVSFLEKSYPELDENSEDYNENLHRELVELYQEIALKPDGTIDPNVSLRKLGERFMRGAGISARVASARTAETVSRQASSNLRNEGGSRKSSKIDANWFKNEYDPDNPEHRRIADEYAQQNQYQ